MYFLGPGFLVFLAILAVAYQTVRPGRRPVLLASASVLFYGAGDPWQVVLLLAVTLMSHITVRWLGRFESNRLVTLTVGVSVTLLPLVLLKAFPALTTTSPGLFGIPVGLSFYSLQAIGYQVAVFQKRFGPQKIVQEILYLGFFPQLLAGPIERPGDLFPQLENWQAIKLANALRGSRSVLAGLVLKVLVADPLGAYSGTIISMFDLQGSAVVMGAVIAYSVYIFVDFYAYTRIALGAAIVFGVTLTENFDRPYLASSVSEFWRTWHISLGRFLKDHVYLPLGGSRRGRPRLFLAIIVVFALSALWHGLGTGFLLWGGLHALLVIGERLTGLGGQGSPGLQSLVVTGLVTLLWVPFMTGDAISAVQIWLRIAEWQAQTALAPAFPFWAMTAGLVFIVVDGAGITGRWLAWIPESPARVTADMLTLEVMVAVFLLFAMPGAQPFLYFAF